MLCILLLILIYSTIVDKYQFNCKCNICQTPYHTQESGEKSWTLGPDGCSFQTRGPERGICVAVICSLTSASFPQGWCDGDTLSRAAGRVLLYP